MPRAILGGRAKLVVIWQELPIITASRLWSQQIGSTQNSLSELSVHPWPPHTHTHMDTHHTCTRMRAHTRAHTPATHAHIYAHIHTRTHARTYAQANPFASASRTSLVRWNPTVVALKTRLQSTAKRSLLLSAVCAPSTIAYPLLCISIHASAYICMCVFVRVCFVIPVCDEPHARTHNENVNRIFTRNCKHYWRARTQHMLVHILKGRFCYTDHDEESRECHVKKKVVFAWRQIPESLEGCPTHCGVDLWTLFGQVFCQP